MVELLPFRPSVSVSPDPEPVILDLSSEEADHVFKALSSKTARRVLQTLYDDPTVASEIADDLETSLQNVDYHLRNLRDAGLVEIVDTWYSKTGNEMKVYAPTAEAVMIFANSNDRRTVKTVATTLLASLALIGFATAVFRFVLVEIIVGERVAIPTTVTSDSGIATEETVTISDPISVLPTIIDPGIVFIAGALFGIATIGMVIAIQSRIQ